MCYLKSILKLCFGAVSVACLSSIAFADQAGDTTLSVKFGNVDLATSDIAGVTAVQTSNWNLVASTATGTAASLNEDVSGVATPETLALSWNAPELINTFDGPFGDGRAGNPNAHLLYGGLGSNGGTATISLSGLGPEYSGGFSLYIYSENTNTANRGGSFTVDSGTPQNNLNMDPNVVTDTWVQSTSSSTPGDYVLIAGLSGTTLTISMTGPIDDEIQGFEIVANPVAAPEPSTYALLIGGILLLGFVARRRCKDGKLPDVS